MAILSETCVECGYWGDSPTKGDGECTQCSGTGIDIGVAVLAGYAGDCERCGGTGVCSACHGTGLRPASEGVDESDSFENSTLNDKNQILTNELAEEELAWIKKVEDYRNSPGDLRLPDCHEGINIFARHNALKAYHWRCIKGDRTPYPYFHQKFHENMSEIIKMFATEDDSFDDVCFTNSSIPTPWTSYRAVINWQKRQMKFSVSIPRNDGDGSSDGVVEIIEIPPVWFEALKTSFYPQG